MYALYICMLCFQLDYVTFTCPLGYVFEGTNNITHYALCHNWEFIYLFDREAIHWLTTTILLPLAVICPPAPDFEPGTPDGSERLWDPDVDQPIFEATIQFTCPEG